MRKRTTKKKKKVTVSRSQRPLTIKHPPHVAMTKAGLPRDLAIELADAVTSNGYMVAVWKLQENSENTFDFRLVWKEFPYDLMLRALKEIQKHVLDMEPP